MQALEGGPNIIRLYDVIREPDSGETALVFERVNNTDYRVGLVAVL